MDKEPSFRVSTAQRVRAAFQDKYTNPLRLNFKQHEVSRTEEQKELETLKISVVIYSGRDSMEIKSSRINIYSSWNLRCNDTMSQSLTRASESKPQLDTLTQHSRVPLSTAACHSAQPRATQQNKYPQQTVAFASLKQFLKCR